MKIITVGNNKGGVGKTMQAYQLTCYLAQKGYRVLAIDLDSQANMSSTLGVDVDRTLIPEWLIGDIPIDQTILPVGDADPKMKKIRDNIHIIPSGRHMANLSKLLILSEGEIRRTVGRKERLLKVRLQEVTDQYDYVIIDTPPMLGDELIMSLVCSDHVLIPTQAQDYSIDGLEELMETFNIIKSTENPSLSFTIIPSMVNPRRKIEKQRLEELSENYNVTPVIRNLVQIQESVSIRRPICLMGAKSRGSMDYNELWKHLNL